MILALILLTRKSATKSVCEIVAWFVAIRGRYELLVHGLYYECHG